MRTKTLEQETAQDFAGLQVDLLSKLRDGSMTFDQIKWFKGLSFEQREQLLMGVGRTSLLIQVPQDEALLLPACTGNRTFKEAKVLFTTGGMGKKVESITDSLRYPKRAKLKVYKLQKEATIAEMYGAFDSVVFSTFNQEQIIVFCEKYPFVLHEKSLFFLLKNAQQEYLVLNIYARAIGLEVIVFPFEDPTIFYNNDNIHLIIPEYK